MLAPITVTIPNKGYEGYTNFETWYVAYWFRADPELNKRYKGVIKSNYKPQNREAAMRILINSKKELFIAMLGIDFNLVNIDELVSDLITDYPF